MKKVLIITMCLLLSALLVVGGCKTVTETVTKTATQSAVTVTSTVAGGTVTSTVTQPGTTVTVTNTAQPSTTTTKTTTTTTSTTKTTTTTTTSTTTGTTQPQQIASPDGKFQIMSHEMTTDYVRQVVIKGVVKNLSSETATAKVRVELHLNNVPVPQVQTSTAKDIPAGGTKPFQVIFGASGIYEGWYLLSFE